MNGCYLIAFGEIHNIIYFWVEQELSFPVVQKLLRRRRCLRTQFEKRDEGA